MDLQTLSKIAGCFRDSQLYSVCHHLASTNCLGPCFDHSCHISISRDLHCENLYGSIIHEDLDLRRALGFSNSKILGFGLKDFYYGKIVLKIPGYMRSVSIQST